MAETGTKLDLSKLKTKDLLALLGKLSPEQMSAVRGVAAEVGLPVAASGGSLFAKLPDGSVRVTVEVPSDLVPGLEEWASAAGETLETYLKHYVVEALNVYSMADWQSMTAAPAPVATAEK